MDMNKLIVSALLIAFACFFSSATLFEVQKFKLEANPVYLPDTIPLNELGSNLWKTAPGGLYPNGLNTRPQKHEQDGQAISKTLIPLDSFGIEDPSNGKIVLLSIGMSNATQEFSAFKLLADTFRNKNPKLLIVDGAQGGQTASVIKNPNANFWTVVNQRLFQQKVSGKQVQAVWLKEANANPTATFPKHADDLKNDIKLIVQILKQKYPNLKLLYLSSRIYGGYANTALNPEPYAYESGFSIKWLVEEQINGDSSLSYQGASIKSPWLSWGPYLWAKGNTARTDGLLWLPADFAADGTHPSNSGRLKVANLLLQFFSTDSTCIPWFLKSGITDLDNYSFLEETKIESLQSYPNPCRDEIEIRWKLQSKEKPVLVLLNSTGQLLEILINKELQPGNYYFLLNTSKLPVGIYYVQLIQKNIMIHNKFIKVN